MANLKVENAIEWEKILKGTVSAEKLIFMDTEFLEFGDLVTVLRLSPSLIELRLERCFHVSNILIQSLADYTPFLENLYLSGCLLSDANLDLLAQTCKNLKRVDFSCTNMTLNALLILMESSPWLEEIDLSEIRTMGQLPEQIPQLVFPSILKTINLRNTVIDDIMLKHIATNCPQLQVLILEDCAELSDSGIMKVASCCVNLETLDLSFCIKITDLSLQAFAIQATKRSSRLKEVHLSACELITPATVHQFIKKCVKLELLVLDGCEKMNGTLINEYATIRDEITCTLERKELLKLAQIPIQQSSFQHGNVETTFIPPLQPSKRESMTRQKSKSIMASASTGVESVEMAFAERTERIKQNRLSRGSFIPPQVNRNVIPPEIDLITEKGRKLAMRRSMSASTTFRPQRTGQDDLPARLLDNLRLRSNTVTSLATTHTLEGQEPTVRPKKSIRPRPTTIIAGGNWGIPVNPEQAILESRNLKSHSPTSTSDSNIITAIPNHLPFVYSQKNRGRFLTKLKVEITKGSLQELSLHKFDDPSSLALEFCNHYGNLHLAESLTRMLTLRKNNALRRLKEAN